MTTNKPRSLEEIIESLKLDLQSASSDEQREHLENQIKGLQGFLAALGRHEKLLEEGPHHDNSPDICTE